MVKAEKGPQKGGILRDFCVGHGRLGEEERLIQNLQPLISRGASFKDQEYGATLEALWYKSRSIRPIAKFMLNNGATYRHVPSGINRLLQDCFEIKNHTEAELLQHGVSFKSRLEEL
ncbi:hypothetical protein FQN54_002041 [Arachnomyces sp. PD_36]|nr:hypothetical protein FQN54_002041 [Arachnomyces sp. PD_36]